MHFSYPYLYKEEDAHEQIERENENEIEMRGHESWERERTEINNKM